MFNDDTSVRDVVKISRYRDYMAKIYSLTNRGYERHKPRNIVDSIDDLTKQEFQVVRVQHFDPESKLRVPGVVDVYTRLMEK